MSTRTASAAADSLDELRDKSPGDDDPRWATTPEFFCREPSRGVAWLYADGSLGFVRCGASNRCDYCAMIAACENAVVLRLDAFEGEFPRVGLTTTTHRRDFGLDELRASEKRLWRWLRRECGRQVEYCGFVEWTTGRSVRSGGARLPHVHHLVKGLPPADAPALETELSEEWRRWTGGAWVLECRELRTPMGAIAYLVLHHHKREQGPPPGSRHVRRLRSSRGYMTRPIAEYRAEARELLRDERLYARLVEALDVPNGAPFDLVEEVVAERIDEARERARYERARLVHVRERRLVDQATGEVKYEFRGVLGGVRSDAERTFRFDTQYS